MWMTCWAQSEEWDCEQVLTSGLDMKSIARDEVWRAEAMNKEGRGSRPEQEGEEEICAFLAGCQDCGRRDSGSL